MSNTSSIPAHHSPSSASGTRSWKSRIIASHSVAFFEFWYLAKSAATSKSSGASRYMNIVDPNKNIFILLIPMLRRPEVTSGQTYR